MTRWRTLILFWWIYNDLWIFDNRTTYVLLYILSYYRGASCSKELHIYRGLWSISIDNSQVLWILHSMSGFTRFHQLSFYKVSLIVSLCLPTSAICMITCTLAMLFHNFPRLTRRPSQNNVLHKRKYKGTLTTLISFSEIPWLTRSYNFCPSGLYLLLCKI